MNIYASTCCAFANVQGMLTNSCMLNSPKLRRSITLANNMYSRASNQPSGVVWLHFIADRVYTKD